MHDALNQGTPFGRSGAKPWTARAIGLRGTGEEGYNYGSDHDDERKKSHGDSFVEIREIACGHSTLRRRMRQSRFALQRNDLAYLPLPLFPQ